MLSFMREQGAGKQAKNGGQDQPKGSADAGSLEYVTVAATSKNVRKSTILVVVLVSIGLVCLWFMIRKTQPQSAAAKQGDAEQSQMEAAIGRLTGVSAEMISKADQILKKFYEFSGVLQVQVNDLAKNPFEVEAFAKDLKNEVPKANAAEEAAMVKRQRLKQKAASLSLLSVMESGKSSSCMINDKLLRQGDTIEGFVVTRIGGDSVELAWQEGDGNPAGGQTAQTDEFTVVLKLTQ